MQPTLEQEYAQHWVDRVEPSVRRAVAEWLAKPNRQSNFWWATTALLDELAQCDPKAGDGTSAVVALGGGRFTLFGYLVEDRILKIHVPVEEDKIHVG